MQWPDKISEVLSVQKNIETLLKNIFRIFPYR